MKTGKWNLKSLIFMAVCCDLGIILKRIASPAFNLITEFLHIPGGIGTCFSLMFIIVGAFLCNCIGSATLMCLVQSLIAPVLGATGSLGVLAVVAYLIPGIIIDILLLVFRHFGKDRKEWVGIVNAIAGVAAAFTANMLTFRLRGPVLWLYMAVAFTAGMIFGLLGGVLVRRLAKVLRFEEGTQGK